MEFQDWPEIASLGLIFAGATLALTSAGGWIYWFTVVIAGALFGHLLGKYKRKAVWPVSLMTLAILVVFLLGTDYSEMRYVVVAYAIGFALMYNFHKYRQ